jgi:thymidylate synthase
MRQYLDLLKDVKENGTDRGDRTGVGTRSVFGRQMRFDLNEGFPIVTTKSVYWKGVVGELLWFLSGNTNIKWLVENNIHIWTDWSDENGDLGPIYGAQWRNFGGDNLYRRSSQFEDKPVPAVDQITQVINSIKTNPNSRRHMVVAWNPLQIDEMALPPCHCLFQFYVANGRLSCQLYQRSCDIFLGLPFNIASYSLLTHMIADICGLHVGEFVWTGGDVHLYHNHFEQAETQLQREPLPLPQLWIEHKESIYDYDFNDIRLVGYSHHGKLPAPIAV